MAQPRGTNIHVGERLTETVCETPATISVADLHRQILDAPPSRSNFLHFDAVFWRILPNKGWHPLWEILDPPL